MMINKKIIYLMILLIVCYGTIAITDTNDAIPNNQKDGILSIFRGMTGISGAPIIDVTGYAAGNSNSYTKWVQQYNRLGEQCKQIFNKNNRCRYWFPGSGVVLNDCCPVGGPCCEAGDHYASRKDCKQTRAKCCQPNDAEGSAYCNALCYKGAECGNCVIDKGEVCDKVTGAAGKKCSDDCKTVLEMCKAPNETIKWYDPKLYICCKGEPAYNNDGKDNRCCGTKSFNENDTVCCNEEQGIVVKKIKNPTNSDMNSKENLCCRNTECCGGATLPPGYECCKGTKQEILYNPKTQACCEATTTSNGTTTTSVQVTDGVTDSDKMCCGLMAYDKSNYDRCCGTQGFTEGAKKCCEEISLISNDKECCKSAGYKPGNEGCCPGKSLYADINRICNTCASCKKCNAKEDGWETNLCPKCEGKKDCTGSTTGCCNNDEQCRTKLEGGKECIKISQEQQCGKKRCTIAEKCVKFPTKHCRTIRP